MTLPRDLGDAATLRYVVRDAAQSLVDPAAITLTVTKPDGSTDTTAPTRDSLGTYSRTIALDQAGLWIYRWTTTGPTTAEDGQVIVEALLGPTLYCTVEEVRSHLGDQSILDAGQLEAAVRAASRAVDGFCRRRFWLDPTATTRLYHPTDRWCLPVEDIGVTAGVQVATDDNSDGVFETSWGAGDRQLEPVNAAAWGGAYAYTRLRAIGSFTFPLAVAGRPTVQVTARHGWSQVPDPVREATKLKAVALWRRKDAPFGVAGFGSFGAVRITRADPDVVELLGPYRRYVVA